MKNQKSRTGYFSSGGFPDFPIENKKKAPKNSVNEFLGDFVID